MNQRLAHITIVVNDYDEAIKFYTEKLHFDLIEDTQLSETKRWVLVRPKARLPDGQGSNECCLLLAKAANEEQRSRVGNQTGGRVFLFLHTDDFGKDYQNLLDNKIEIVRQPTNEVYGTVAVFKDLYGNLWDMIGPHK
jgi:catechol 2,3-dioxygenase-like lactoylglutathione lyase family enzyme